jgi:hypothetical protein
VAERSGDTAFHVSATSKSGVALHFPPQSKTGGCGFDYVALIRVICAEESAR